MTLASETKLRRPSLRADAFGRYYTSAPVSQTLIDAMHGIHPKLVLELGSGHGALASAARKRWPCANYVTVDTDQAVAFDLTARTSGASHTHHVHDALDDLLADRIGIALESVDVGLCNPPYVRPPWQSGFGHILEEAGLSGTLQSVTDAGADLLFVAQNLRLLKRRGKLGLILPDGLISGEKYQAVRQKFLREHLVELVVQLPRRVFTRTEAQTYLMVLSKNSGETEHVTLRQMHTDGTLSTGIKVPADLGSRRLDYAFHARSPQSSNLTTQYEHQRSIGEVYQTLIRGNIISSQIRSFPLPVFHLGDFPEPKSTNEDTQQVPDKFILPASESIPLLGRHKFAQAGDILIARIGRNLQHKVCILTAGLCAISDCVYALRTAPDHTEAVFSYLASANGRSALEAASHGVGAKYLSRSDVLSIALPT